MWGKGSDERVDQNVNRVLQECIRIQYGRFSAPLLVHSSSSNCRSFPVSNVGRSLVRWRLDNIRCIIPLLRQIQFLRVLGMKTKIKELREKRNLTQEALAEKVDVTRQTILFLEKGKYNPSLRLAYKIAKALNSKIGDVFSFEDERL